MNVLICWCSKSHVSHSLSCTLSPWLFHANSLPPPFVITESFGGRCQWRWLPWRWWLWSGHTKKKTQRKRQSEWPLSDLFMKSKGYALLYSEHLMLIYWSVMIISLIPPVNVRATSNPAWIFLFDGTHFHCSRISFSRQHASDLHHKLHCICLECIQIVSLRSLFTGA